MTSHGCRAGDYFMPYTSTWKEAGSYPRPPLAFGLAAVTYTLCVPASRLIVRDPAAVSSVCTTVSVSPATFAIVILPSRHELNASLVPASYHVASVPAQMATDATTLPLVVSIITMCVSAPTNRRCVATSMSMPVGLLPGATDQLAETFLPATSITSIWSLSSMLTNTRPAPSARPVSAVPVSGIVAITAMVLPSIAVADLPV